MTQTEAPRPFNEDLRAKTVVKTGFTETPNTRIFDIYCELAKDISKFKIATFSLFDSNEQCSIAKSGDKNFKKGTKSPRDEFNICTYVLLNNEPLIIRDIWNDPVWKKHPKALDKTSMRGYAGFPVINKDNYALGTLCLQNPEPITISPKKIFLMKEIASNISLLLDTQIEQKEATAEKFINVLSYFHTHYDFLTILDIKHYLMAICDLNFDYNQGSNLVKAGLIEIGNDKMPSLSIEGKKLKNVLDLKTKQIKKIKLRGNEATNVLDEMLSKIE
tara:strand:+ start:851 stop:1675 length:825 start_codon:yes stop_codon:yes gene_type:complete